MSRLPKFSKYGGTSRIWPVTSRMDSHSPIVGTETPRGAARSVLLRTRPWRLASRERNRRKVERSRTFVIAHPALSMLQVRGEPKSASVRPRAHFGEPSVQQIHSGVLCEAKRQELKNGG